MSVKVKENLAVPNVNSGDKSNGVLMRCQYSDLVLLNFEVDPESLKPHVPNGLKLALYNDSCFVSLVAKRISKVNYGGFILPMMPFVHMGLRIYVRRQVGSTVRHGIYYLQEYVQRKSVASVLNWFFQSTPKVMKMKSENTGFHEADPAVMPNAMYRWQINEQWNRVRVTGHSLLNTAAKETKEQFVLDCRNMYYLRKNELCECFSEHPPWVIWGAASGSFDCDTEALFGRDFVKPLRRRPASVFLARGSDVSIYRPTVIN